MSVSPEPRTVSHSGMSWNIDYGTSSRLDIANYYICFFRLFLYPFAVFAPSDIFLRIKSGLILRISLQRWSPDMQTIFSLKSRWIDRFSGLMAKLMVKYGPDVLKRRKVQLLEAMLSSIDYTMKQSPKETLSRITAMLRSMSCGCWNTISVWKGWWERRKRIQTHQFEGVGNRLTASNPTRLKIRNEERSYEKEQYHNGSEYSNHGYIHGYWWLNLHYGYGCSQGW